MLSDPGARRAAVLTVGLWTAGFFLYVGMIALAEGAPPPPLALAYISQWCVALALATLLIVALSPKWAGNSWRRAAILVVLVPACSFAMTAYDNASLIWLADHVMPETRSWARWNVGWLVRTTFIYFWVFCVNATLILLARTIERARRQERELADVKAGAARAQLAMLRYQLNPHFLFNTLNAISSLVVTGRVKSAEEMIDRLAGFLRESLASDPEGLVPLEEELSLVREYLEIEAVRFGERLRIAIDSSPAAAGVQVPGFLLQPLAENAVKYAVGPAMRPVTIAIHVALDGDELTIRVADDGAGGEVPGGTGLGLRNVRERLQAHYGDRASLAAGPTGDGYAVTLRLPAGAPR